MQIPPKKAALVVLYFLAFASAGVFLLHLDNAHLVKVRRTLRINTGPFVVKSLLSITLYGWRFVYFLTAARIITALYVNVRHQGAEHHRGFSLFDDVNTTR